MVRMSRVENNQDRYAKNRKINNKSKHRSVEKPVGTDRHERVDRPERISETGNASIPEKPKKEHKLINKIKAWKTWQKAVALILIIVLILVTTAVTVGASYVNSALKEAQKPVYTEVDDEGNEVVPEFDLGISPVNGFINILLLGVDTRDMNNIKGSRSDMIMIASINQNTYDVTLTSVYRDTYMKIGATGTYDKITHACSYGGPEMTMLSLNQALDLNLQNYAIVNFKAVADIVDAVGGITVNVDQKEIEQLNKYTKASARNIGYTDYHLVKHAGVQKLCGVQAVSYGRIRKGVGDDYKRTERMRTVVSLVFEKAKDMKFSELKAIIDELIPQVKTNLKMNDILALGSKITKYDIKSGAGFPYQVAGGYLNNISYVFPVNLANSTAKLHQDVFGQAGYYPSSTCIEISSEIQTRYANRNVEEEATPTDVSPTDVDTETPDGTGAGEQNPDENQNVPQDVNQEEPQGEPVIGEITEEIPEIVIE